MTERVETVVDLGDRRVHRFQVVREREDDGTTRDWVVVELADESMGLSTLDFEWTKTVPFDAVRSGRFEPLAAGGVPVWGY